MVDPGGEFVVPKTTSARLVKFSSSGIPLWEKIYTDSTGSQLMFENGIVPVQGGYTIASSVSGGKISLSHLDINGNVLWHEIYGDPDLVLSAQDLEQSADGGYILLGGIRGALETNLDALQLKVDSNGSPLWQKRYTLNGTGNYHHSVKATSDGGYLVFTNNNNTLTSGTLLKLDANGNVLWQKINLMSYSIMDEMSDGYVIIYKNSSYSTIQKLDPDGNLLWAYDYGTGIADLSYEIKGSEKANDGNLLLGGTIERISPPVTTFSSLVKLDNQGNILLERAFASQTIVEHPVQLADNSYMLFGSRSVHKLNSNADIEECNIAMNYPISRSANSYTLMNASSTVFTPQITAASSALTSSVPPLSGFTLVRLICPVK